MTSSTPGLASSFPELISRLEEMTMTDKNGHKKISNTQRFKSKATRGDYIISTSNGPLVVHSWKFPEFEFTPEKSVLPCQARGLFTTSQGIVARGYDKFFNIGEFPSLTTARLKAECTGPFNASTKENGCIIFFAGLEDGTLLVCSKNVTGDYSSDSSKVSHYSRGYQEIERQLAAIGKTPQDLARTLYDINATAVAELCDDTFEEHVLEYLGQDAGLYLHGINKNSIQLETAPAEQVSSFGKQWGFKNVDQLHFDTFDSLMEHLDETAKTGMYKGREIEGFVVRCKRQNNDFFFKYKFEEPYLLYRQWREVTHKVFSCNSATKTIREVISSLTKHQRITFAYLLFVKDYFSENPEAQEEYDRKQGVIKIRKLFLRHLGLGDSEGARALELDGNESLASKLDSFVSDSRTAYCVITMAAPGCGKSTVCRTLAGLNSNWVHVENDDFTKGNLFIEEILKSLDSKQLCFVDRMNYRERYRADLFRKLHHSRGLYLSPDVEVKFIGINFLGSGVSENTKDILQQRLMDRGDDHQSVQAKSNPKQAISLMQDVCHGFQAPALKNDEDDYGRIIKGKDLTKSDENFAFVINLEVEHSDSSLENAKIVYGELVKAFNELEIQNLPEQAWQESYAKARQYIPQTKKKVTPQSRKVEYYGIAISRNEVINRLDSVLGNDSTWQQIKASNRVQEQLHVTLAHNFTSKVDANKQTWADLGRLFSKNAKGKTAAHSERVLVDILCNIKIHRILVVKGQLIALEVTNDEYSQKVQNSWIQRNASLPYTNKHLHITIGTVSPEIKPMMSNVYLEHLHGRTGDDSISVVEWEHELEQQAAFIKFF